jgi:hypothetical protein
MKCEGAVSGARKEIRSDGSHMLFWIATSDGKRVKVDAQASSSVAEVVDGNLVEVSGDINSEDELVAETVVLVGHPGAIAPPPVVWKKYLLIGTAVVVLLIILCWLFLPLGRQFTPPMPGVNLFGGDYLGYDTNAPDTCETACKKDGRCQAWTYVNPGIQGPSARCYLKSVIPSPTNNSCCTSGYVKAK